MAIDPRIALEAKAPDISGIVSTFQNALLNAQKGRQNEQVLQQANVMNPLLTQQAQQGVDINTQNIAKARNESRFKNIYQTSQMLKPFIANNDAAGAEQFMLKNISRLQDAKARGEDVDLTESLETLEQIKAGNLQGVSQNIAAIEGIAQQRMNKGMSAGQREFQYHMGVYNDPKSDAKTKLASGVFLGLDPRAGSSAAERSATDPDLGQAIVKQKAAEAGATEGSKLEAKLKWQPKITKAVKLAEKAAIERGDVLNDLDRMTAALPGVRDAVSQLRELAPLTTTTWGGKVWDAAVKQTGFGATKGSTAAAKFQAIVDNQVLPLLKPTFGGSFSVQEGESLKATLGDVNASAEEKLATLDAFINQKERDIQSKKTQTNQTFNFDAQGNLIQ
tara:strand:- start:1801 stop:2973 length:1173 start_codon:yes stop_codon:yes gene_type:complete